MKSLLVLIALTITVAPLGNKELRKQLRTAVYNWNKKIQNHTADYGTDHTWLDVGVRFKYAAMKDHLSLKMLETISGKKVFIGDSPHGEHPNFDSQDKFGHYNPEFILAIHKSMTVILENPNSKPKFQKVYDNHLKNLARTYYISAVRIDKKRTWRDKNWEKADIQSTYQDIIDGNNTSYGTGADFLNEVYRSHADEMSTEGYDWYEADVAPGFWIRRTIDGTNDDFLKLLNLVLDHLDPDFEK